MQVAEILILFGLFMLILVVSVYQVAQLNNRSAGISKVLAEMQTAQNTHQAMDETLWETSPQAMYLSGTDGHTTWVNEAYLNLWGLTMEEATNDTWLTKLTDESQARAIARVADVFTTHEPWEFDDLELKDGRTFKVTGGPVFDAFGNFTGFAGTVEDVTS